MRTLQVPDVVPVLSQGKHRNPRKGACFMEFASYLAGERWSDKPACTHPLLAGLARLVNDNVSDDARAGLVSLIPRVVGLDTDDRRMYAAVSVRAAASALPIAPRAHQRALAVGLLVAEHHLHETGPLPNHMSGLIDDTLAFAPDAERWARSFRRGIAPSFKHFEKRAAPRIVLNAVDGIVRAADPSPNERLTALLESAVGDCEQIVGEVRTDRSRGSSLAPAS